MHCACECMPSCIQLFATLWTAAHRVLCPWDSPGKNTGVGCHTLFQGIFPTRDQSPVSCITCLGRQVLYTSATWKAHTGYLEWSNRKVHWEMPGARMWVVVVGKGNGELAFMGTEFQFRKVKNLGDGWWWELHNNVDVLSVTELYSYIWLK